VVSINVPGSLLLDVLPAPNSYRNRTLFLRKTFGQLTRSLLNFASRGAVVTTMNSEIGGSKPLAFFQLGLRVQQRLSHRRISCIELRPASGDLLFGIPKCPRRVGVGLCGHSSECLDRPTRTRIIPASCARSPANLSALAGLYWKVTTSHAWVRQEPCIIHAKILSPRRKFRPITRSTRSLFLARSCPYAPRYVCRPAAEAVWGISDPNRSFFTGSAPLLKFSRPDHLVKNRLISSKSRAVAGSCFRKR
jgi:hypothetical protein